MSNLIFHPVLHVKRLMNLLEFLALMTFQAHDAQSQDKKDWITLFNGKDLSGWEIKMAGHPVGANHLETFVVEDETIRIKYDNYEQFDDLFGHMYYHKPFSYYRLKFEYRFTGEQLAGGASWNVRNSGIMLHSQSAESNEIGQGFPVSIELQLLGGLGSTDRTTANVCTPGTAVVMGDSINYDHCINSNSRTYHGDQWVQAEALVLGGESMTFIVEGDTVLTFEHPQIGGGYLSEQYNGQDWGMFGIVRDKDTWIAKSGTILTGGYIALQAESHPIDFRKIRLLDLEGCMDPEAKNFRTYFVKHAPERCAY